MLNMTKEVLFEERYRPQIHFTPVSNWLNDPNGMVYYNGEYHLFYQHHPEDSLWGPMHWGHAISTDLIHWEHMPIALKPDHNGMIFSGSAVVDWEDTSGFFSGGHGLVVIYTSAKKIPDTEDLYTQTQSLAFSTDNGRTWVQYEGNPVLIDEECLDFRDPKVFWHEEQKKWVMALVVADHVRFYESFNLTDWKLTGQFGRDSGSHDGVWECPDLFELSVDGDPSNKKWVLIVSIGDRSDLVEGSRTQYFIGHFDGNTFHNDHSPETILWFDYGRDNYAGVTWSDIEKNDGRRIFIGWMSNWKYARLTPTSVWRGAMTLPRVLSLVTTEQVIRLAQTPVEELQVLRTDSTSLDGLNFNDIYPFQSDVCELEIEVAWEPGVEQFGFALCSSAEEKTIISMDVSTNMLIVDRTQSGEVDFHPNFSCKHEAQLFSEASELKLRLFLDRSSIEIFANNGTTVVTDLIFPKHPLQYLETFARGGKVDIKKMTLHELQSVYKLKD
ncbi:glycoside hydrolase family 32 protein [Paenibacillus puerhi]|uniref:glycoside hydrolase family 32 protein n=1 Tax=Paenibacillus puerhi TaxID=2692622 RepID=UPI001357BD60|nr:glycoside hydrolase family 32 protein [Paenibacillus puerhi]